MERTWTEIGADYVERLGKRSVEHEIEALDWQDVKDDGITVAFIPGQAIKEATRELRIPNVTKVAISSFDCPATSPDQDGFYPGFYGIEGNYKNGRARVYVLDTGTSLTP